MLCHAKDEDERNEKEQDREESNSGTGGANSGKVSLLAGSASMALKTEEIDHLLKKGAYDVFRGDEQEGKDFVAADLDAIMARAAHKVSWRSATLRYTSLYRLGSAPHNAMQCRRTQSQY